MLERPIPSRSLIRLKELIKTLKAKRSNEEYKLRQIDNDPSKHDFYGRIARLSIYDVIIPELEAILEEFYDRG